MQNTGRKMKKSFKHLFLFINKSLHRFLLWMKPAYIRHRTPEQKRFDLKIQYTFLGCLIGMLAVALLLYYKTHHQTEQLAEISQQEIAMEETITSQETEKEGTESLDETEPLQLSKPAIKVHRLFLISLTTFHFD